MAKTATVRARVEPQLKEQAEEVLSRLGLNPTAAITLYYQQIVKRHGIPFPVSLPNAATRHAMQDAEQGNVTRASGLDDRFEQLDSDE